jgi:hypothetical protein
MCDALGGLVPEYSWKSGSPRETPEKTPSSGTRKESYCTFRLGDGQDGELANVIGRAVESLAQHAEFFRDLRATGGSAMFYVFWYPNGDTGDVFGADLLTQMGQLGIEFGLNVYDDRRPDQSFRFRMFMMVLIMGVLVSLFETIEFVNGWYVYWPGFAVGATAFLSGLIGTSWICRAESLRSYRNAVRRIENANSPLEIALRANPTFLQRGKTLVAHCGNDHRELRYFRVGPDFSIWFASAFAGDRRGRYSLDGARCLRSVGGHRTHVVFVDHRELR